MLLINRRLNNTQEQLTADFGEYPLRCFSKTQIRFTQFFIVDTSPLNRKLYDWILLYRGFKNNEFTQSHELNEAQDKLMQIKPAIRRIIQEFMQELKPLYSIINHPTEGSVTFLGRAFSYVSLAAVLFLLTITMLLTTAFYILPRLLLKATPLLFKKTMSSDTRGMFLPISYDGKMEIIIHNGFRQIKGHMTETELISHEHIHLLQFLCFSPGETHFRHNDAFLGDAKENLINCLKNPEVDFEALKYILNIDEMEARLHEAVLSFYRENRSLPKSFDEYINLFSASETRFSYLSSKLLTDKDTSLSPVVKPYKNRSNQAEIDIRLAILRLKDEVTMKRYILEALPVMYANLLVLYGYVDEAISFLKTVPCIDLFEDLYGISAMPEQLRSRTFCNQRVA